MADEKIYRCLRCGKRIKDPKAIERGYGDVCYQRLLIERHSTKKNTLIDVVGLKLAEGRKVKDADN